MSSLATVPEYSIRLANTNRWEPSTGYNSLQATLTVTAGIADWRQTNFGTTTSTCNAADSAGDGVNNLLEYALGGNPTSSASAPAPTVGTSSSGGTFLTLTFLRARSDLTYVAQGSNDLVTWTDIANNTGTVSLVTPVTYTDSVNLTTVNPPRRFLRLRVTTQ